ncbi:hypothetical protein SAMN06272759_11716 [Novosphingobium sp. B1]|nr:hypothetical protein SAMN06272759_11716 [Novosphingobium sp. B1]
MCLLKRSYRLRSSALRYTKSPSELSSGKWAQADDHSPGLRSSRRGVQPRKYLVGPNDSPSQEAQIYLSHFAGYLKRGAKHNGQGLFMEFTKHSPRHDPSKRHWSRPQPKQVWPHGGRKRRSPGRPPRRRTCDREPTDLDHLTAAFKKVDFLSPQFRQPVKEGAHRIAARQQRIEPFERAISMPVCLAESFGVTFGGHDQLGGMGEGRVTSPADPRQELTAFFGIPRAHKLVGLDPRIVFNSNIIKRIIAHMHAPEAPE